MFSGPSGYAKDTCKNKPLPYPARMTIYGYARVSTDGQSVDAQVKPSAPPEPRRFAM